jgi:hypothetical protein
MAYVDYSPNDVMRYSNVGIAMVSGPVDLITFHIRGFHPHICHILVI